MKTFKESIQIISDILKEKKDNPGKTLPEIVEILKQKNKPEENTSEEENQNPS